jgi:tRNA1(Val) A37 N6-methylase TrmN6
MDRNAKTRAPLLVQALGTAGVRRILDLGGGSGAYSIAFAKTSSDVRCDILDIPEVVPLTTEYVNKAGVSAQISLRAGDMLTDDLGSGYDIIMLNAICHMFSEEQNQQLFRRARQHSHRTAAWSCKTSFLIAIKQGRYTPRYFH